MKIQINNEMENHLRLFTGEELKDFLRFFTRV